MRYMIPTVWMNTWVVILPVHISSASLGNARASTFRSIIYSVLSGQCCPCVNISTQTSYGRRGKRWRIMQPLSIIFQVYLVFAHKLQTSNGGCTEWSSRTLSRVHALGLGFLGYCSTSNRFPVLLVNELLTGQFFRAPDFTRRTVVIHHKRDVTYVFHDVINVT